MPHKTTNSEAQAAKAERARQYLSGGGVIRDDSDDELGLEDHPWQWIYSEQKGSKNEEAEIIGARMGAFECMIGDCVLLKAEGTHEAWVGLICDFREDEGEKSANFMWFSTQREIRSKTKKRNDALPVSLDPCMGTWEADSSDRMRSTLRHRGIGILWRLSMEGLSSSLLPSFVLAILWAGCLDHPKSMARSSSAAEAATLAQPPTQMNSNGKAFTAVLMIFPP